MQLDRSTFDHVGVPTTEKKQGESWVEATRPEHAEPLYERLRARLNAAGGAFGAHMEVELVNDGPVTILLESP